MTSDAIRITESRRLPGPNMLWDRPGAVMDIVVPDDVAERLIAEWRGATSRILPAVGWAGEGTAVRRFPGGASLAISAPIDVLYAATEVNEWAFAEARARLAGEEGPAFDAAVIRLLGEIEEERSPPLRAMEAAAREHHVVFQMDPRLVSVGGGTGGLTWPVDEIPEVESVDWSKVHDVPMVLVTGSNGKTTTVRLLTAVLTAAGRVVGMCCTDSVNVGSEVLSRGDWSGPGGARMVLRDRRVEVAVLETARGGILRRGLAVRYAQAAIVTNIAEDHFGEWGINDLAALAEAKLVVARALGPEGRLVLNADDPHLVAAAPRLTVPLFWISLEADNPVVRAHLARGGDTAFLDGGDLVVVRRGVRTVVAPVAEVPITLRGAARHNVHNVLGVIALATSLGLSPGQIAPGLARFRGTADENPGRLNLFDLGGVTVVADFAHNPHGMDALVKMASALPARRRLLMLGHAGDRDDNATREFARSAWAFRPDRIVLKEMEIYLRGRAVGESTGLIREEFLRGGAVPASITHADSEYAAVLEALAWARPGDLLLLPLHAERERVLALLDRLQREGWAPESPVPA
jgi:cyanophycin synthetase